MRSVFVSSTFKDMQFERDMLQTVVEPQLNATAVRYADSVFFADLRWGISTEDLDSEDGSRKILSVCLDEIDRCRPYMLIFIGDRYGWIPEEQLIRKAADEKRFALPDSHISVTSLEIEFGALQESADLDRCIFCFRDQLPVAEMSPDNRSIYDSESAEHRAKLQALKDKIRSTPGAKIIDYKAGWDAASGKVTGLEDLAEKLTNEMLSLFSPEWKQRAGDTWQQIEKDRTAGFIEKKSAGLYIRPDIYDGIMQKLENGSAPLIIRGASGSGKTTVICQLAEALQEGANVCTVICGNSERMLDIRDILRYMIYFVEELCGRTHAPEDGTVKTLREYRSEFEALLDEYESTAQKKLVFLIDAVDQLSDAAETVFLILPEKKYKSVRFAFSTLESYEIPAYAENRSETVHVRPLDEAAKRAVIESILKKERKEVAPRVIDAIVGREASDNPLYMSLLLRRLVMFNNEDFSEIASLGNDMEAITSYMMNIVESCPPELGTLCRHIADEAGGRINRDLSGHAMRLIAASRFGLRESDMRSIFESRNEAWSQLDFSRLTKYFGPFLIERTDGRIDFTHKSFREGLREADPTRAAVYDREIYDCLSALPSDDPVRQSEIIYHMYKVGDKDALTDMLWNSCALSKNIERETKELRLLCIEYGPEWLISVIKSDHSKQSGSWFYSFFSTVFCGVFRETALEQKCLLQILLAAEEAASESGGFQSDEVRGTLEYQIANIFEDTLEDGSKAIGYYEKAYTHLKNSGGYESDLPARLNLGIICNALASHAAGKNDFAAAEKYYAEADALYSEPGHFLESDPNALRCRAENELSWADCMVSANAFDAAVGHLDKAKQVYESIPAVDPALKEDFFARADNTLVRACMLKGDYARALGLLKEQENYRRREYDRTRDLSARKHLESTLMNMANIYSICGYGKEAVEYAKEAEENARLVDAEMQTAASARSLVNARYRSAALIKQFDPALAGEFAEMAVNGAREVLAGYNNIESRENLALALKTKADIAQEQKDWDQAERCAKEAAALFEENVREAGPGEYETKVLYSKLTVLKVLLGRQEFEGAFALQKEMLEKAREQLLVYPGPVSFGLYDDIIEAPFDMSSGWQRPEYMKVAAGERTATIMMKHDDPVVLAQAEGVCRGACYQIQGLIRFYTGDQVAGMRDMMTAEDAYRRTYEKTGNLFFERKADKIKEMIRISTE